MSYRKGVNTLPLLKMTKVTLLLILLLPNVNTKVTKEHICVKNCGQCKEMFGDNFNGRLCAEFCLQTEGSMIPDCGIDDPLVTFFLERME